MPIDSVTCLLLHFSFFLFFLYLTHFSLFNCNSFLEIIFSSISSLIIYYHLLSHLPSDNISPVYAGLSPILAQKHMGLGILICKHSMLNLNFATIIVVGV